MGMCRTCNALAKAPPSPQPMTPPSAKTLIQVTHAPVTETTSTDGVLETQVPVKAPKVKVLFTVHGGVSKWPQFFFLI